MARLSNSNLQRWRPPVNKDEEHYAGDVLKVENEKGDTMVFTPIEVKKVLKEYISNELQEYANEVTYSLHGDLKNNIDARFKRLEKSLEEHITNKILKVTEKVLENLTSKQIEAEVERRVDERLKKNKRRIIELT